MNVIGIDPGKKGAIVFLMESGLLVKYIMPLIGNEFDLNKVCTILYEHETRCDNFHIFIEDVHAIFGSAAGATFSFGYVCGAIRGIVTSRCLSHTLVQPKAWQKVMYQGIPEMRKAPIKIKKGKRTGQMMKGRLDTKAMSLLAAKRLFPNVDLRASTRCTVAHDGIVDALLIAAYGKRLVK